MRIKAGNAGLSRVLTGAAQTPVISSPGTKPREIPSQRNSSRERLIAQLSDKFRVVAEGVAHPLQWMLQRRKSAKAWQSISWCQTRNGLLLAIREKCIAAKDFTQRHNCPGLDPEAIAVIKALPDRFPLEAKNAR